MKKTVSLLLLCSLLLSGCASTSAPAETTPVETIPAVTADAVTEPAAEPATEPTLSAEELFIQSLPEKLRDAYELGIVELDLLKDLNRECTTAESAAVLQKVYNLRFYEDSWMLTNTVTEENASTPATRGWFMTMMYAADAEGLVGVDTEKEYAANLRELTASYNSSPIADALLGLYDNTGYVYMENTADNNKYQFSFYGNYNIAAKKTVDLKDFNGDIAIVSYALTRFDRNTGEKLMTWDENRNLHFKDAMTIQEVVETALRYYNALEPKPDMFSYEDAVGYDESIITPDLLARESSLPDATCSQLPAQWHGITLTSKQYYRPHADMKPQEHEVQAIQDAGFNFIRYPLDFEYYHGRVLEDGKMNENRLKELDQLLAWCMERDIHLNIASYWTVGWPYGGFSANGLIRDTDNAIPLTNSWKVLAKRYADIPNRYLSFSLLDVSWGASDEDHAAFLAPVADAVRQISPDRCMMTNVGEGMITGTGAASLGLALTSPCTWGEDFIFSFERMKYAKPAMEKAVWPYEEKGSTTDGNAVMEKADSAMSPDAVAAVAKEYGVGYMVHEWGPRLRNMGAIIEKNRYSSETMEAYLTDMVQTMEDRGYGWCYTDFIGSVGIACGFPLVETASYTQTENYPFYVDEEMTGWFRKINGIA